MQLQPLCPVMEVDDMDEAQDTLYSHEEGSREDGSAESSCLSLPLEQGVYEVNCVVCKIILRK